MKLVTFVTSALRRVRPQGMLLAGLVVASVTGLRAQTITTNQQGTNNGFFYSYWKSGGTVTMTLGSGGNYAVSWNTSGDFTCGKGWNPGSARTVGYNCGSYSNSGGGSLSVYGWTTSPLLEYYIVETWGSSRPVSGTYMGSISSDGGTYDIYHHQQVNQPSIQGTATFWQDLSIRQAKNSTGANHSVTTANHFNKWNSLGMTMGTFNYMILLTEGWNGSGYANATVW